MGYADRQAALAHLKAKKVRRHHAAMLSYSAVLGPFEGAVAGRSKAADDRPGAIS